MYTVLVDGCSYVGAYYRHLYQRDMQFCAQLGWFDPSVDECHACTELLDGCLRLGESVQEYRGSGPMCDVPRTYPLL